MKKQIHRVITGEFYLRVSAPFHRIYSQVDLNQYFNPEKVATYISRWEH